MRFFFLIFCFVSLSSPVQAARCAYGDLMLEYVSAPTSNTEAYTARLSGTIEVPTPNYDYEISVHSFESTETQAELDILVKDPNAMSMQVITPITIDETIKIPRGSTALMIDVVKPFNWGAEYYRAEYPNGFENTKSLCMKAEMYK